MASHFPFIETCFRPEILVIAVCADNKPTIKKSIIIESDFFITYIIECTNCIYSNKMISFKAGSCEGFSRRILNF